MATNESLWCRLRRLLGAPCPIPTPPTPEPEPPTEPPTPPPGGGTPPDAAQLSITFRNELTEFQRGTFGYTLQGLWKKVNTVNNLHAYENVEGRELLERLPWGLGRGTGGTNSFGVSLAGLGHGYEVNGDDLVQPLNDDAGEAVPGQPDNYHDRWELWLQDATLAAGKRIAYVANYRMFNPELRQWLQRVAEYLEVLEIGNEQNGPQYKPYYQGAADPNPNDQSLVDRENAVTNYYGPRTLYDRNTGTFTFDASQSFAVDTAEEVRTQTPDVKLAVCLPPPEYAFSPDTDSRQQLTVNKNWVDGLATQVQPGGVLWDDVRGKSYVDLIVHHPYNKIGDCYESKQQPPSQSPAILGCLLDGLQIATTQGTITFCGIRFNWEQYLRFAYVDYFLNKFPGQNLFFSEWGCTDSYLGHGDTVLGGMNVFMMLIAVHRINHERQLAGRNFIEYATYQSLLAPSEARGYEINNSLIVKARAGNVYGNSDWQGTVELEAFALWKVLEDGGDVVTSRHVIGDQNFTEDELSKHFSYVAVRATNGDRYVFYANRFGEPLTLNLKGSLQAIGGEWYDNSTDSPYTEYSLAQTNVLPARSFGRLKLN